MDIERMGTAGTGADGQRIIALNHRPSDAWIDAFRAYDWHDAGLTRTLHPTIQAGTITFPPSNAAAARLEQIEESLDVLIRRCNEANG